ncbi:hypothetical protein TNCV_3410461 [Trichonephila clavipes]|nr:hypothetical protein TNCV_3410461 [Trichonephila clavipes]
MITINITKSPNWSPNSIPIRLYHQDFTQFPFNRHYNSVIGYFIGTAYRPENIQEKDRYPTCSIMVWAGIMINGRTRLHVVANMTGQRYIDEVLLPHVRLSVVLSVINLFLWTTTQHVIEHSLFRRTARVFNA